MGGDDDFDFDLDVDFDLGARAARLAFKIGKELGLKARNFGRFNRGELEWNELTHLQQTLFLGGDREQYETIKTELRQGNRKKSETASRRSRAPVHRQPKFNYDDF